MLSQGKDPAQYLFDQSNIRYVLDQFLKNDKYMVNYYERYTKSGLKNLYWIYEGSQGILNETNRKMVLIKLKWDFIWEEEVLKIRKKN